MNRKIFYLDSNKTKSITSGGVIIYRFLKGYMELLLMDSKGLYHDLGGRTDIKDKDILSTVSREAFEESNELLNKRKIRTRLKYDDPIYIEKSKYVIFIIEASKEEEKLISSDFGVKEKHDNINRTIKWISLKKFLMNETIKYRLNWRLKNKKLFDKLNSIKNDRKINMSVFSDSTQSK